MEAVTQYDERALCRMNNFWPIKIRFARPRSKTPSFIFSQGRLAVNNSYHNSINNNNHMMEPFIRDDDTRPDDADVRECELDIEHRSNSTEHERRNSQTMDKTQAHTDCSESVFSFLPKTCNTVWFCISHLKPQLE